MPRSPPRTPTLEALRAHAVVRSLFRPTTLPAAIRRLGFVQADPIRAPARAQDLTLRHRVAGYRAGDLEARYPRLAIEEDHFINYGFLPRDIQALMHPRSPVADWPPERARQAADILAYVRERGVVHPREVDAEFAHGKALNWFGGASNASTQLLEAMHYRGLLRVARREGGVRLYAAREAPVAAADPVAAIDALVDVVVAQYAPLPMATLGELVGRLRSGVPQWLSQRAPALQRARARLPQARVAGIDWIWPAGEDPAAARHARAAGRDELRLLAPFDPVVWDRRRFGLLWGWAYRFEAYTPAARRVRGYYALPMLWRDQVIGWANLQQQPDGALQCSVGHVAGRPPAEAGYRLALQAELDRIEKFLQPGGAA